MLSLHFSTVLDTFYCWCLNKIEFSCNADTLHIYKPLGEISSWQQSLLSKKTRIKWCSIHSFPHKNILNCGLPQRIFGCPCSGLLLVASICYQAGCCDCNQQFRGKPGAWACWLDCLLSTRHLLHEQNSSGYEKLDRIHLRGWSCGSPCPDGCFGQSCCTPCNVTSDHPTGLPTRLMRVNYAHYMHWMAWLEILAEFSPNSNWFLNIIVYYFEILHVATFRW